MRSVQHCGFSVSRFSIFSYCLPCCSSTRLLAGLRDQQMDQEPDKIVLSEEQKRTRRARSVAIALALGALVILFYVVTLIKGPGVLNRPL